MALATKNTTQTAWIYAICAESGAGKTTMADKFLAPYHLNIEGNQNTKHLRHFSSAPTTYKEVLSGMTDFAKEKHEHKTLIIDSVSQLERLFMSDISAAEGGKSFVECCGGYGKAYELLHQRHKEFMSLCAKIRDEYHFNVVLLFHSTAREMELPGMPSFQRWMPTLWKNDKLDNNLIYQSMSDNWFHLRMDYDLVNDGADEGSKIGADQVRRKVGITSAAARKIGVQATTTYFAKNRLGLNGEFPFNLEQPLLFLEGTK